MKMTWNRKTLALAEHTTNARAFKWRGSLCNNIGWTYHAAGQYVEALEMFERALQNYQKTRGWLKASPSVWDG